MKAQKLRGREKILSARIASILVFATLLLSAPLAQAVPITIEITGNVTSLGGYTEAIPDSIYEGVAFTGTYTYKSSTIDSSGGHYVHDAPYGISIVLGGYEFKTAPSHIGQFDMRIADDLEGNGVWDYYLVRSYENVSGPSVDFIISSIEWNLWDSTHTALSSGDLPATVPVLTNWDHNVFKIHGLYGTNLTGLSIYGTVTQAVPEPLTGVLMVIGVFFFRRRRKTMNAQKPRGREGILSAPIASIFVLATLLLSAPLAKAVITDVEISANFASIIDVIVIPSQPLDVDFITLDISGSASSGNSHIVSSLFQQEENQLTLDLTIDMGISPVISYWSHSEQIGPLVPDTYSATVRLFYPYALPGGELQDTYVTEFTVTPEPGTLLLFGLGGLLLRSSYNNLNISKGESYET